MFRQSARIALAGLLPVLALAGCGVFGDRPDTSYTQSREAARLEVPPDLMRPGADTAFSIPERGDGRVSAVEAERRDAIRTGEPGVGIQVLPDRADVRARREGNVRWLEVEASPSELWPRLRSFFREMELTVRLDDPELGILETEWFQERANIPLGGGIRGLLGRAFGAFYDASTRDQFRLRLERESETTTAIFVSHRSAEEVAEEGDVVRWRLRPSSPEAEAEMMVRLMTYLGRDEDESRAAVAGVSGVASPLQMVEHEGEPALQLSARFVGVWRRMGVVLDRASLLVDDQDRSAGIYYVTFRPEQESGRRGLLGRIFGGARDLAENTQYQVHLTQDQDLVRIRVRDRDGERPRAEEARAVLERIEAELR